MRLVRHARLREQLSAYADGLLSTREARRLEGHLGRCEDCRGELDALRRTVDLLRALPAIDVPDGLEGRLLARLDEAVAERDGRRGFGWLRLGASATSLAGAALLALAFVDVEIKFGWPGDPALPEAELESITLSSRPFVREARPGSQSFFLPAGAGSQGAGELGGPSPGSAGGEELAGGRLGFSAAPSEDALAVRPSMRACLTAGGSREACSRWQSWMLDLAAREPRVFVSEFETVPESEQPLILQDIRDLAWGTGTASFVIDRLRSSGDPRASSLASRLAFAAARDR